MYDLESEDYSKTFDERIGGHESNFIRAKDVEQNLSGNKYAIPYIDNGEFRLRVFTKNPRP